MAQIQGVNAQAAFDGGAQVADIAGPNRVVPGTQVGSELAVSIDLQTIRTLAQQDTIESRNIEGVAQAIQGACIYCTEVSIEPNVRQFALRADCIKAQVAAIPLNIHSQPVFGVVFRRGCLNRCELAECWRVERKRPIRRRVNLQNLDIGNCPMGNHVLATPATCPVE